jgi:hypothetical protein
MPLRRGGYANQHYIDFVKQTASVSSFSFTAWATSCFTISSFAALAAKGSGHQLSRKKRQVSEK